jgi:thermostable 8-oxoguanine DNA glycosylase
MIDPTDPKALIRFDRNLGDLEEFLVFSICVAGHAAIPIARGVDAFLASCRDMCGVWWQLPFEYILNHFNRGHLAQRLKANGIGKYNQRAAYLEAAATSDLDLFECSVDDLDALPGIGPKTARFFVMCNRPDERHAILDVHILRYMRETWGLDVPRGSTMSAAQYARWEPEYLSRALPEAERLGMTLMEYDLSLWNQGREG